VQNLYPVGLIRSSDERLRFSNRWMHMGCSAASHVAELCVVLHCVCYLPGCCCCCCLQLLHVEGVKLQDSKTFVFEATS